MKKIKKLICYIFGHQELDMLTRLFNRGWKIRSQETCRCGKELE